MLCVLGLEVDPGQSLGSVQLCLALLQGNTEGAEEHSWGRWPTPEQWLSADPLVSPLSPDQEKHWGGGGGWHDPKGMLIALCRLGVLISALFPSATALQPLEHKTCLIVCSLATATILMLRRQRQQAEPPWSWLAALQCLLSLGT